MKNINFNHKMFTNKKCLNKIPNRSARKQKRKYSTNAIRNELFKNVSKSVKHGQRKVTVVGAGQVDMATVMAILSKNIASEICIIDLHEKLVKAEANDMQHGSIFLRYADIYGSNRFEASEGSVVCVITAGTRRKQGQTRLDLLHINIDILADIMPKLVKYSPNAIFIIVTNPCDVLSYAAWKFSGIPKERILGTGTHLDTARFRYYIAQRLGVAPSSVHGYIIGEHGDSSVPVWSGVNVGGTRFSDFNKCIGTGSDQENWNEVAEQVVQGAYAVSAGKGCTNWAVALTSASITEMILDNKKAVAPVSTHVKDHQGLDQDVFLSLPVVIGSNGISSFVNLNLNVTEQQKLCTSADVLDKATRSIDDQLPKEEKC